MDYQIENEYYKIEDGKLVYNLDIPQYTPVNIMNTEMAPSDELLDIIIQHAQEHENSKYDWIPPIEDSYISAPAKLWKEDIVCIIAFRYTSDPELYLFILFRTGLKRCRGFSVSPEFPIGCKLFVSYAGWKNSKNGKLSPPIDGIFGPYITEEMLYN